MPRISQAICASRKIPRRRSSGRRSCCWRKALFPGGLLDVLPIAQRDLIDHLPFGVILSDPRGVIIDMNAASARGLAISRLEALGRTLDAVLGSTPRGTGIEISPIELRGGTRARLTVLNFPATADSHAA
jgi:PAS domain-containing protein